MRTAIAIKRISGFFFILILTLIISSSALFAQEHGNLKVMTWNIRLDTPDDGVNQWKYRKKDLSNEILKRNPDLLGVQEAKHNQMKNMRCLLRGYKSIGVGRDDGKKEGEYSALFYQKSRLNPVRSGTFWLSETPDVPGSRGWDAACNRVVTWAEFEEKATGRHFIAFNTHFDHMGEEARIQSALLIIKKLGELAGKLPIILTGDLNVTEKHRAYRILTFSENEYTLSDSRKRADVKVSGPDFSFVGFDPAFEPKELIDYILVTWDLKVISSEIYDFRSTGKYLSDHLPVIAEIHFK
ncbi:MAG: endonuclease/exonuclease/phosphatase family protein [Bacteroidales bacterium]|nr:endonuclease/exonuclease/phosphatase family protein [Bacteroidales bacterium]